MVAGLWGNGNTVTERSLIESGQNTVYNMWNGEGLVGPRAGVQLQLYAGLWSRIAFGEFLARYGQLDDDRCRVFEGDEQLGLGCDAICRRIVDRCGTEVSPADCRGLCDTLPRARTECLEQLDTCQVGLCRMPGQDRPRP